MIKRLANNSMGNVKIPKKYCLGTGHETFFFDKLEWLYTRYFRLYNELLIRKVNVDPIKFWAIADSLSEQLCDTDYWNDYNPSPDEIYLNMSRLCRRSKITSVLNELKAID